MSDLVTAHIITQGLLIECDVISRGMRMLELLNDPATHYISLSKFSAYRVGSKTPLRTGDDAIVCKDNINFVVLDGNRHETPERRALAFKAKDQYEVFLTVRQYGIHGRVHVKGIPDAIGFLRRDTGMFLPVTDARVFFSGTEPSGGATQTVIVNKQTVDLFQLSSDRQSTSDVLDSLRQLVKDD